MDIRFYAPADFETTADLFHELGLHYFGEQASDLAVVREHLRTRILGPHSGVRIVLVMEAGRALGLATIALLYPAPQEQGQLFLKDLYVARGARDRAIGERLMRWLAAYALEQDCVRLDWTSESGNPSAQRFYARLGAQRVEEKIYWRFSGEALREFAARSLGGKV